MLPRGFFMKLKLKLSILVIAVMVFVVLGISVMLLKQSSGYTIGLNIDALDYAGNWRAADLQGRENSRIQALRTIENVMSDYENIPAQQRRDQFENIMQAVLAHNPGFFIIYTVWKPNAVDGMDSYFSGRTGSSPTGQFALEVTRENGRIEKRTVNDLEGSMEYLTGPDSNKEMVSSPEARTIGARNTYIINFMVPIVNPRTNETVGAVGGYIDIDGIQTAVEDTMNNYDIISLMAIYDNSGFILANTEADRVGKNMRDVETLYGYYLEDAVRAVARGYAGRYNSYSLVLDTNVQIQLTSFQIGNSDKTWTVMIAATEDYMLLEVRLMTHFTIILAVLAIAAAAVIIYFALGKLLSQS